jgi:hypothetical protein
VTVLDWLLDLDPAVRWQVLRDLFDAPAEMVAAERALSNEGWGAALLALQGDDRERGRSSQALRGSRAGYTLRVNCYAECVGAQPTSSRA